MVPPASPAAAQHLADLLQTYDRIDTLLETTPVEIRTRVVSHVSGWSCQQHLAHLALANELCARNLASLARGEGLLVQRGGEADPRALEVLAAGRLPRGEAQSPRMVRPPAEVDPELLRTWLDDGRAAFAALDPATLVGSELKIAHQVLGPLDATQWARFACVHTHHHLEIAQEVLAAAGS
jgi:hypothetical protein